MTRLSTLTLILFLGLSSQAAAQAGKMEVPGPTMGPMPDSTPNPDDYPNPTETGWGDPDGDPCDLPFPIALCGFDLTGAASEVGKDINDKADNNWVYGTILWVAETFGPNVPTGDDEKNKAKSESNREELGAEVIDLGGLPAVRSFAAFMDPAEEGDAIVTTRPGVQPRAGLMLHSKWEMDDDDDDEYTVRVTARQGQVRRPMWLIARRGRLYLILPTRD